MPFHSFDALDRSEEMPGYLGAFVHGENMTVTNWSVEAGAEFPEHEHPTSKSRSWSRANLS